MSPRVGPLFVSMLLSAHGFHTSFMWRNRTRTLEKGHVSGLITFGAPAAGSPALANPLDKSHCFPGIRIVATCASGQDRRVDAGTEATADFGFQHPTMPGARLDLEHGYAEWAACGTQWAESFAFVDAGLHHMANYSKKGRSAEFGAPMTNASWVALPYMYNQDPDDVGALVRRRGWHLVDSAIAKGSLAEGEQQVAHLLQDPQTLACMLTFQGSSPGVWHDAAATAEQAAKVHFCGLVEKEEACAGSVVCQVRGTHSSFVHRGFRDRLRQLVSSEEWQRKIRPSLPACSEVVAVGHSIGGAVAQLFAACAAKALKPGDYGYEGDYEHIGWKKNERPGRLNYQWDWD